MDKKAMAFYLWNDRNFSSEIMKTNSCCVNLINNNSTICCFNDAK